MPDVRAMVRLWLWLGVPLDWIYLGQMRHVELGVTTRLAHHARQIGAHIGGPAPDWPSLPLGVPPELGDTPHTRRRLVSGTRQRI